MSDLRDKIEALGYSRAEAEELLDLFSSQAQQAIQDEHVIARAAELIHLIFLRIDRDSAAGCALRRALGFSGGASFARAAKDFGCSKQHLHTLQARLETQLGPLSFLASAARAASTGPSGGSSVQR